MRVLDTGLRQKRVEAAHTADEIDVNQRRLNGGDLVKVQQRNAGGSKTLNE
jgi:hypothetical protein